MPADHLECLLATRPGALAIAVSGGLDSLTLMALAHGARTEVTIAVHAVSPAVQPEATDRVRETAAARDWMLRIVQPGEFEDSDYLANPVNRCFFCKNNLFQSMRLACPQATLASGTNTDDLGDFRPGLAAGRDHAVWTPYVEAGLDKAAIRQLARDLDMPDVAALPAQPCLASRIETGIAVRATDLAFVNRIEGMMTEAFGPGDHRCRVTRRGIVLQTDGGAELPDATKERIMATCTAEGRTFAGVEAYVKGSAFLRTESP